MGPDRHVGMRLSACSTIRKIPDVASGMWPHTDRMRPHTRRDAWNFPYRRARAQAHADMAVGSHGGTPAACAPFLIERCLSTPLMMEFPDASGSMACTCD